MKTRHGKVWMALVGLAGAAAAWAAGCDGFGSGSSGGFNLGRSGGFDFGRPKVIGEAPSVPEGREAYTILLCPPYLGADHARDSAEARRKTEAATGWKNVYVVHEDRTSSLFLGRYAKEEEALRDIEKVRQWKTPQGTLPFQYALVTKRAGQHVGPPEWDLAQAKVDRDGYTVVIAEFHNVGEFAERMEMTVENCRDLRGTKVEAYYFHGPTRSYLTIGVFPAEAYQTEAAPRGGVRAVLVDERIKRILRERPFLAVNGYPAEVGEADPRTHQGKFKLTYVTPISEFLVGKVEAPPPRRQPQPRQGP